MVREEGYWPIKVYFKETEFTSPFLNYYIVPYTNNTEYTSLICSCFS